MKKIGKFILVLIIGIIIGYFIIPKEKEIIKVPVTVEIEVPAKSGTFEPIENPEPIIITNTEVDQEVIDNFNNKIAEYEKANDSLQKELFKSAVTQREYEEKFEDSVQTITVNAKVTGTLDKLWTSYETKPFTVKKDTILDIKVPANKRYLSLYLETGLPSKNFSSNNPIVKGGFDIKNKKNMIYGGSYSTNGYVFFKVGKGFNF